MNNLNTRPEKRNDNLYFENEADEILFLMELDELVIGSGRKLANRNARLENSHSLKG